MESKFLTVNSVRLHYIEEGAGELVILLHGFPEFWYGWRKQIPVLSKSYRVVAPDMRGYNLSDKPEKVSDYKMQVLAKDIAELIKALGEENAIVVGHDWGAAVAWAVASLYPEVVKKLAILNVPHPNEMRRAFMSFNLSQWKKSWYIFFFQLPFFPEKIVGTEKFFRQTFSAMSMQSKRLSAEDLQKYVDAYAPPGAIKATIAYYRAAFREIFSPSGIRYPKIKAPVLMLWGEHDKALGKELTYRTKEYCENICEILYDSTSGHFVQHDNPEWVNEKLLSFFAQA
ncbi:MAG: alpha/beta hydrolase [Chitinophagales bacterium]|nr:alpha/beta hydrolase [Chitinophagales bacterium]